MLPPLKALQAFEATARLQSFSKAAESLYVTQSAISHQIKQLENFFGQPLLERQGKNISLTQSGDMLYTVVKDCFWRLNSVTHHLTDKPPVELKVLAQTSVAVEWLAPRLERFKQAHPQLDTLLDMATFANNFDADNFDIILGTWPSPDGFVSKALRTEYWYPVCSPEQYAQLTQGTPEELMAYPLYSSENGEDWSTWCQQLQLRQPATLNMRYVRLSLLAAKAVSSGIGFAMSNDFIAESAIASGQLVALRDYSFQLPWGHYQVHYKMNGVNDDAILTFVKWVASEVNKEPPKAAPVEANHQV